MENRCTELTRRRIGVFFMSSVPIGLIFCKGEKEMDIAAIVGILAAVSGIFIGWTSKARQDKKDVKDDATVDAVLRTDIGYIRHSIDDVRMMQAQQGQRSEKLTEQVIRLDESAKQAHKRIDRLEGLEGGNKRATT